MAKLSERKKKWIERTVEYNRSYKLFLYNRFFIFLLAVLAQMVGFGVLLYMLVYDSRAALAMQAAVIVLELITVLYVVNKSDRPGTKLNWVILILLVPVFGVPMYFLNGGGRATRRMNRRTQKSKEENEAAVRALYGERTIPEPTTRSEAIAHYLAKDGYPAYDSGKIEYYKSGEEMFPEMLKAIEKAEKFILVEYFIIKHGKMWNEILKRLLEKATSGVQIRIIYDDFGCMMTLPPKYDRYLEAASPNIKCMPFNEIVPFFAFKMNSRDHRKILVVDGKVAFTGGMNLADEYIGEKRRFGYWKDSGVRIEGEAVNSFTQMFFYLWNAFRKDKENLTEYMLPPKKEKNAEKTASGECVASATCAASAATEQTEQTGQTAKTASLCIQPYDDSPLDRISVGETVYIDIVNRAAKYVWFFTPYLVLDDYIRSALRQAAARGVDVRIVTPGIPDKKTVYRLTRANYAPLMSAGVKIYEYSPGFIHSKSVVCDDECAVVGTVNLDYRSLYHHFENAVYFCGCEAVMAVKRDCEETFAVSKLCTKENTKRGIVGRLVDSVLRVFETLL